RAYRYRAREFEEIVTRTALRKLQRAGATTPRMLRALLYERLNREGPGYLPGTEREDTVAALERELALRRGELEQLLYLDADEHAILSRVGAPPRPEDVVAQHNAAVLVTLLRHSERAELHLERRAPAVEAGVRALA